MSDTMTVEPTVESKPSKVKKEKVEKPLVACWCGCGGQTRGKFVPGHDSRFHGNAKRVARGLLDMDVTLAGLAHDEARAEFRKLVEHELPKVAKWKAEEEAKATRKAEKEAAAKLKAEQDKVKEAVVDVAPSEAEVS